MIQKFFFWLPFAITITAMCGLIELAVHQNYRQSANDPQIQLAEDSVTALENGQTPQDVFGNGKPIDMEKSLQPFGIIFDDSRKVVASLATLDGKTPMPPSGVFDYARKNGTEWFTWQPKDDVRSAVVLMRYSGKQSGFVLAGRSLREVEKREHMLLLTVAAAWATTLFATFAAVYLFVPLVKKEII